MFNMKKSVIALLIMCGLSCFAACSDTEVQDFSLTDETTSGEISDTAETENVTKSEETLSAKDEAEPTDSVSDTIDIQDINNMIYSGDIEVTRDGKGVIRAISGKFTDKTVTSAEDAAELLNSMSTLFGDAFHADASDFTVQEYDTETVYRYSPTVNSVSVAGSQIVLSVSGGEVTYLSNTYDSRIESVCTELTVDGDEAENIAVGYLFESRERLIDNLAEEAGVSIEEVTDILLDALEIRTEAVITEISQEEPRLMWSVLLTGKYQFEDNGDDEEYCDWNDIYDYGKYMWSALSSKYYICANGDEAGEILYIDDGMIS